MQDSVFPSHNSAQSLNPSLSDGLKLNHLDKLDEPPWPTFSDALRFGMGGNGSGFKPDAELKSGLQSGTNEPIRVLPLGESSTPNPQSPSPDAILPQSDPNLSVGEFLACCLLGKVWGKVIPLHAIMHRTRNDWNFVKGHVDYVDLGNNWILLRFSTS